MWSRNRVVSRYCNSIYTLLPCDKADAKRICTRMQESVESYLLEQPSANYDDIIARFGSPEQVAISLLEEQQREALLEKMNLRKRIFRVVVATAILFSVCIMSVMGYVAYECYLGAHGKAKIEIIEEIDNTYDRSEMIGAEIE